jgi:hypothetical protein
MTKLSTDDAVASLNKIQAKNTAMPSPNKHFQPIQTSKTTNNNGGHRNN